MVKCRPSVIVRETFVAANEGKDELAHLDFLLIPADLDPGVGHPGGHHGLGRGGVGLQEAGEAGEDEVVVGGH